MSLAILEIEKTVELDEQGNPRLSHRIRRTVSGDAYVFGMAVEALCGYIFTPSHDPKKFPLCQRCKELWEAKDGDGSE